MSYNVTRTGCNGTIYELVVIIVFQKLKPVVSIYKLDIWKICNSSQGIFADLTSHVAFDDLSVFRKNFSGYTKGEVSCKQVGKNPMQSGTV